MVLPANIENKNLLTALLGIAADAVISIDSEHSIVVFNFGAEQIFGYRADEVLGRPLAMLLPSAHRANHDLHIQQFRAQSHQASRHMGERGRIKGLRKNGEEFDADASISHLTLNGQDAFMVVMRDVSEQIRQERALRSSELRLQTMLDTAAAYVGLLDPEGHVLDANKAALDLLNLRREDILGKVFWETPWWADSPARQQRLRTAVAKARGGETDRFETQHPTAAGGLVDVDFILTPVRDDSGRVTALLPEGRDITERKRAEEARSISEARLQFVVNHSPDNIFIQDLDLKYRWVANTPHDLIAERLLGRTDLEYAVISGSDRIEAARIDAIKREVLATDQTRHCDVEFTVAGEPRYFEAIYEPMRDANGQVTGLLGYARDRTKEHADMRLIKEARLSAERAAKTKSRFLAVASHDLRQPLQTVGLLAGTLSRLVKDPDCLELIEQQRRALASATELLNTLLDVSKLESGALQPELQQVSLSALFSRLAEELSEAAKSKKIRLHTEPTHLAVKSDPQWLRQILQNLLANALRYTPEGGAVTLRACAAKDATVVEVVDTGVGIPADKIEHIFDEFYQISTSGKERRGWGLGLSIVKHAANMLGHDVQVASTPGKGSTFRVRIEGAPHGLMTSQSTAQAPAMGARGATNKRRSALIIDDDQAVATATGMLLKVEGFHVDIAYGSEDLNRLLDQADFAPEVIVSDVQLGEEQTGPDLVRRVRDRLHRVVPAVLVSGDTTSLGKVEGALASSRIMNKPVAVDELLATLKSLVDDRTRD